jgi:protein tyrosine/serine phosphatase
MHARTLALAVLVAATPLAPASAAGPDPASVPAAAPIGRFVQLETDLYRGAQPDAAGFRYLRDLGIKTVVSFRNDVWERELVESLGMRFVSIPVTFRAFGWGDDFDLTDVQKFLEVVDDPDAGPVFFHCKRGADRTGSFAAIYRIARQGWSEDEALDEARDRGMRWWYFPMRGMVKDFARQAAPQASTQ